LVVKGMSLPPDETCKTDGAFGAEPSGIGPNLAKSHSLPKLVRRRGESLLGIIS